MAADVCPLCRKPVGLGTFFVQFWVTRIDCPSCRKPVKVEGMLLYYLLAIPLGFGASIFVRAQYGREMVYDPKVLGLVVVGAGLLMVLGLMSWMKLVPPDDAR